MSEQKREEKSVKDCIMTGRELAERALEIAQDYRTVYMYACYGFQVTDKTIREKSAQNLNGWYTAKRINRLKAAANQDPPVWGFDCVNLIKGILWGWTGDAGREKGGAVYAANGIPDTNADGMIGRCREVSADFSGVEIGEAVWMSGHIGVYVGEGLAVECTPNWKDGVQVTAVANIGRREGYNARKWTKHGKLPRVDYGERMENGGAEEPALGRRFLRRGCVGEDVREMQRRLIGLGYGCGPEGADGEFGPGTLKGLTEFQAAVGLTADGIFGPESLAALEAATREADGAEEAARFTVVIRGLSAAEAAGLAEMWPGCEVGRE